jgi:hypothetical protein
MKTSEDYVKELSNNKKGKGKKKIILNKKDMHRNDVLFIWSIGDLKYNIMPNINMLNAFHDMLSQTLKNQENNILGSYHIFVPPYVKVKKIKINNSNIKVEGAKDNNNEKTNTKKSGK